MTSLVPEGQSVVAQDASETAGCRGVRDKCCGSEVTDTTCNHARATKRTSPLLGNLPNTVFKGGGGGCCWEHLVLFYCLPGTSGLKPAGNNRDVPGMGLGPCLHRAHELSCWAWLPKINWISDAMNYYLIHTHLHTPTPSTKRQTVQVWQPRLSSRWAFSLISAPGCAMSLLLIKSLSVLSTSQVIQEFWGPLTFINRN